MGKKKGRWLSVSPFRRLVADLMRYSQKVPSVSVQRHMDLSALVAARQAIFPRPTWTALFTKAYSILGRDYPELRRSYMTFPWARFYEHPHNVATASIEREINGEKVVLYCLVRAPENRSLAEIDEIIRHHKEDPIDQVRSFQRSMALARCPRPIRSLVWWVMLSMMGKQRCRNLGTFGITSVSGQGAGILHLVPLLTSTVYYGLFDKAGGLDVRMAFDHRVFDGSTAARVVFDLEQVLNREILQECQARYRAAA